MGGARPFVGRALHLLWLLLVAGIVLPAELSAGSAPHRRGGSVPTIERGEDCFFPEAMRSTTGLELLRSREDERSAERERGDPPRALLPDAGGAALRLGTASALLPPRIAPAPHSSECFPYFPTAPPATP